MLWDLNEGKHLYSLEAGDIVNALVFSPNRYWLCAATASCVKIFDLESKSVYLPLTLSNGLKFITYSFTDPLLTSSSRTLLTLASNRGNLSVCRLHGQLMDRLSLVVSATTRYGSGPSLLKKIRRWDAFGYRLHDCFYHFL